MATQNDSSCRFSCDYSSRRLSWYKAILVMMLFSIASSSVFAIERKDIDKRSMSESDQYYIGFASRSGSITGHAFVFWSTENSSKKMSIQTAFGFYPKDGNKGIVGEVPGEIVDEYVKGSLSSMTKLLSVRVNLPDYRKSLEIKNIWSDSRFNLTEKNCVVFVHMVAKAIGLKTPESAANTMPNRYIQEVISLN